MKASAALLAALPLAPGEALLAMRFMPRVCEGDKRIIVVAGEIYGSYLRRAPGGGWIQIVSAGAVFEPAVLGADEVAMVAASEPHYRALGIYTLGYDLIRDDAGAWRVSEINAGNIGGFARLEALGQGDAIARLAGWLVAFAARGPQRR